MPWKVLFGTCYAVARMSLMVFYVATIVRIAETERGRRWLAPFAAAGRMPLTNYLLQSAICLFIFYGWGLGYWGSIGWAWQFTLDFGIFIPGPDPVERVVVPELLLRSDGVPVARIDVWASSARGSGRTGDVADTRSRGTSRRSRCLTLP